MVVGYIVNRSVTGWIGPHRVIGSTEYTGPIVVTAHEWVSGATLCQCIDETVDALRQSDTIVDGVIGTFDTNGDPVSAGEGAIVVEVLR